MLEKSNLKKRSATKAKVVSESTDGETATHPPIADDLRYDEILKHIEILSAKINVLEIQSSEIHRNHLSQADDDDYRRHYASFVSSTQRSIENIEDALNTKLKTKLPVPFPQEKGASLNRRQYAGSHRSGRVNKSLVLWEAHYGAGMVCSPYAMFIFMLKRPEYKALKHVWVINSAAERERLTKEFLKFSNVSFISSPSAEYYECLATAGYIIGNVSLPTCFSKKEEQVVVNTWHSVTVKTLGFDQPNGLVETRNVLRSFLATDYILSPNPFMTKLFRRAYKLQNIFNGRILETGFPRADITRHSRREQVLVKLISRGVSIDPTKKLVLYAPTWRGETVSMAVPIQEGFLELINTLKAGMDSSTYQLVVKPHNLTYRALEKAGEDISGFIPPHVDANELLSVTDILISDYSSIFYDFLPTGRPVLFFIPDLEKYTKERGMVVAPDDLPGPISADPEELCKWINEGCAVVSAYEEKYKNISSWAGPCDDGSASRRAVKAVFKAPSKKKDLSRKARLLIYGGPFEMNGVTTTLIAKLRMIDYERVDVTLYVPPPPAALKVSDPRAHNLRLKLLSWVPKKARVLMRVDTESTTIIEEMKVKDFLVGKLPHNAYADPDIQASFAREYRRCFGDARFDYVVDYSGYSLYWPAIFAQAKSAKRLVWQHNELERDFGNEAKRLGLAAKRGLPTLEAMGGMYEFMDKVVACGESVMYLNRAAMSTPKTYDRFTYVSNVIDFGRVIKGKEYRYCISEATGDKYERKKALSVLPIDLPGGGVRSAGYFYADVSPGNKTGKGAERTAIPLPRTENINFVAMGRFSTEKNHRALIQAFSTFSLESPEARLYIIGDGALRASYEELIKKLELGKRVILTGALKNPFGLAAMCDCFVLPSLYEGMPISPLEARVLGLPIILTNFNSVGSVTVPGGQYLVGNTPDALCNGLRAYRDGKVPRSHSLNIEAYNARGLSDFYRLLDMQETKQSGEPAVNGDCVPRRPERGS